MITVKDLSTEEKLRLICGKDCWHTCDFDGKIPFIKVTDATMGIRMPVDPTKPTGEKPSVAYPSAQILAHTWNEYVIKEYAECVADDCLDAGADILLGPGINIKRSPLCGRNFEYFSEDPFLAGTVAKDYVEGLQSEGAGACVKHFCANNLEYNRMEQSSEVDERTLREVYYRPFEIACKAKPVAVMSSYNRINGVYGSEYKKGYDVLRKDYAFDGLIMSDWDAVRDRTAAAKAGCDLEMPFRPDHYEQLVADYKAGKIPESVIDDCAGRVLELVYRCKQLQSGKKRKHSLGQRIAVTQKVEEEGIVLLKNDGILPLKKGVSVSACGLYARPCAYAAKSPEIVCGGGSGCVKRVTEPFDIIDLLGKELGKVLYEPAFNDEFIDMSFMIPGKAVENAAACDVNVVFAGTGARVEVEASDRRSMKLSAIQERTIIDTATANPNTVVVLFAGSPIDMTAWLDKVSAVLFVGFPGEKGGEAIANVLTGKVNPSGKLTETFPLRYEDTPAYKGYIDSKVTRYEEGLDVGYRYYDRHNIPVAFPFGFGLSYSSFEYENLKLEADEKGVNVYFDVKNVSATDGKEVSQVYVKMPSSHVYRPVKELKGFTKTEVLSGKKKRAEVRLDIDDFKYRSVADDEWLIEDGVYEILVAASAKDIKLSGKIKITGGRPTVINYNK